MSTDVREDLGYMAPEQPRPPAPPSLPAKPRLDPRLTACHYAILSRAEAAQLKVPVPIGWRRVHAALVKWGLVRDSATVTPTGAAALAAWRASR